MVKKTTKATHREPGPVVVCTGFHRSATSLTAQLLHAGGMDMGRRLVSAHLSNPDGHFEDIEMVNINDRLLSEAGTDWRFHDETPLPRPETSLPVLHSYIARRDATHIDPGWGVKDPRISLFLPIWSRALQSRGRFLLVIRHWGGSIQSLYNRHSRVLVEQAMAAGQDPRDHHLSFWTRPGLAARMWIAYSRRILEFAKLETGKVLLLPQPVLRDGFDIISWMNSNWGTKLNIRLSGIVKPELLTDELDSVISEMITPMLRSQMDDLWAQLLAMSCEKLKLTPHTPAFQPVWREKVVDPLLNASILSTQKLALRVTAPAKIVRSDDSGITDAWTVDDFRKQLQSTAALPSTMLSRLYSWLESNAPDDAICWQEYGVRALRDGAIDLAEQALQRSAATGRAPASLWLNLGNLYERTRTYDRAEYHYREAIRRNNKNSHFVITLAKLLVLLGRTEESLELLDHHIAMTGHPALVTQWCQVMAELGRYEDAKARVYTLRDNFPEHDDEWLRQLAVLELPLNAKAARQSLNETIRRGVDPHDLPIMLSQVLRHVDSNTAFWDLAGRMLTHWRGIFTDEALQDAFGEKY